MRTALNYHTGVRVSQSQFRALYGRAKTPSDLPWASEEPRDLLVEIARARERPGRALDVGCGTGMYSVWLARQGWQVTGIDFIDRALEMARERSQAAGAEIQFEKRDVLAPQPSEPFDLVVDVGCLHNFGRADERAAYRANLVSWLAPGSDYYLGHFERRHVLDWRPIGPRRFPYAAIVELFSSLELREHRSEIMKVPFPIGPTCQIGQYWFRRMSG